MLGFRSAGGSWQQIRYRRKFGCVRVGVGVLVRGYNSGSGVFGHRPTADNEIEISTEVFRKRHENCKVYQLVNAYRAYGHRRASVDPVDYSNKSKVVGELNISRYGLSLDESVRVDGILHGNVTPKTVTELTDRLEDIYCGNISYEFSHLESEAEREWFAERVEGGSDQLEPARKLQIARELLESQAWDRFLAVKFPTFKRYAGEGSESMLNFFSTLLRLATAAGVEQMVLGTAHRGKLNLLSGLLGCAPVKMFHKLSGQPEFPADTNAACDSIMHYNASHDITFGDKQIHVSLMNNPSHLEAVNPVSMGKARAKQLQLREGDYSEDGTSRMGDKVLNVQVHGDAALAGQGVNQETLMLSRAPHFAVGGSVHAVVNNQIGFTMPAERGRSSRYCTDVAKVVAAPVVHVNAESPELVVKATKIAFEYQRKFRKDVFLDYNCYRRWGHNEMDDPTFTNPRLYKLIHNRKSIPDKYSEKLKEEGLMTNEEITAISSEYTKWLQSELDAAATYELKPSYFQRQWSGMKLAPRAVETWDTGVDTNLLKHVAEKSVEYPANFEIHPHIEKVHIKSRRKKLEECKDLDWSTAEAMAFGSLLMEGRHVRLSGEDVGRGTFSHRHAMLVEQPTDRIHVPLNHIHHQQKGFLELANSILSEEAVLGYEYGMASETPAHLFIWEAQFGDFFNGAQIMIDTFIASGETKWMTSNGLVMMLPHGYDGAASEHSSCRLERFLQLTDSLETAPDGEQACMHVANPTTPAQYFHLLRRQMVRDYRKPLVVISPKILLRHSDATSHIRDMAPGTYFRSVIGDHLADPLKVRRVILVSGKHYYELNRERVKARIEDVALVRVEALCPFPLQDLQQELNKFSNARTFIWSQEEHRNMGAWTFIKPRFENLLGRKLQYAGRAEAATPAVGSSKLHRVEVEHVLREPLYNIK